MSGVAGRPAVLTIAGFDPSGGAGVLADCKTFEVLHVYGFAVCTAITHQSDRVFERVEWQTIESLEAQLKPLSSFDIAVAKIGLIQSVDILLAVLDCVRALWPKIKIVWDPVAVASAGFTFHRNFTGEKIDRVLAQLELVTPNLHEIKLFGDLGNVHLEATELSKKVAVLLKGGHGVDARVDDVLFTGGKLTEFSGSRIPDAAKHGSGCVLSAAIAAYLARGQFLPSAITHAREYVRAFLGSNNTLLGFHTQVGESKS